MASKSPFLCASDYVFYLRKHGEDPFEIDFEKMKKVSTLLRKLTEDIKTSSKSYVYFNREMKQHV